MPPLAKFTDPTRPDAVPGIAAVEPGSLEWTLRVREYFELAPLAKERGLVYGLDGALKLQIEGQSSQVAFPLRSLLNRVVTHNHPAGQSFSCEDIVDVAADGDVAEIRVVARSALKGQPTRTFLHRAVRPDAGWPRRALLRAAFKKADDAVDAELDRAIRRREISVGEAELEHLHRVWTRVGKTVKFVYERVLLDP